MKIKKAITFRASSIGDCLMAKYLLENIHAEFPQAQCGIVVASRAGMISNLLQGYPWIDVIESNRRDLRTIIHLWRKYRQSDLVVTQYSGKKGGKFSFVSKIMARILARRGGYIGFNDAFLWNKLIMNTVLPVKSDQAVVWHEREVLRKAGIPISLPIPTLIIKKIPLILDRFGLVANKFIIVHLFAGGAGRGLNLEKKRELIMGIFNHDPSLKLVITGGMEDKEEALRVADGFSAIVIAGEVNLQELINIISESRRVISVDTGIAHITAQLRKPLIVLRTCVAANWWFREQYGADAPIKVLSHDQACAGRHTYKNYPDCINQIPIAEVVQAVKDQMN